MIDFVPCEDDCCAAVADALFGECKGTPLGKWSKVLKLLENYKAKIGIIDNDNNQIIILKKYGYKLVYDNSDFKIYKKNKNYVIILVNSCEEFLNKNSKIRDKYHPLCPKQLYKIDLIRYALKDLGLL